MNDLLFGNNNAEIVKRLSKRYFKKNRIRNIAAILAIMLTAFLFTSVTSLAFGVVSSFQYSLQMQKGSKADGTLGYMTEEQFQQLVDSDFVEIGTELETPMGTSAQMNIGGDAPFVYISDNAFKQIYDVPTLLSYGFNVDKTMQAQMEEFLNDYKENDSSVAYTSTKLLKEQMYAQRDILLIVGGMIGAIMAFAGLINFTNMMVTNIITRRHEFAAMQSIGMTNRQLRRLIMDEGLYYAAGADVIGGLLAAILGVTVLKNVLNSPSMWYFTLRFTLVPALFIAVIYLILAAIIPVVVLHFFNKGSVVERLRTE